MDADGDVHLDVVGTNQSLKEFDTLRKESVKGANKIQLDGETVKLKEEEDDDDDEDKTPCCRPVVSFWVTSIIAFVIVTAIVFLVLFFGFNDTTDSGVKAWRWCIWAGILGVSFILIRGVIQFIFFMVGRLFFFSRVYYYIIDLGSSVTLLIWVIIMWPIWVPIVGVSTDTGAFNYINKGWQSLIVISIFRCIKILLDKIIISRFHQENFWTVLWESLKKEKTLKTLIHTPDSTNLPRRPEPKDLRQAWNFINKSAEHEIQRTLNYSSTVLQQQAKDLAELIFKNVDKDNKGKIVLSDMEPFFEQKDRLYAFELLDGAKKGSVKKEDLVWSLKDILKARKFLYDTLHDRDNIGSVVSRILGVIFWCIMGAVVLVIFGLDVYKVFLPFGTFILAFAFVFGNSLKTLWEAAIFIFVIRPYDVGDRVQFGTDITEIVSRINLLTTEAYSTDGRLFIHHHSQLYNVAIVQFTRSKDYALSINVDVHNSTTEEQLKTFAARIGQFISTDKTVPWKWETWSWGISSIEKQNKVIVWLWIELTDVNWTQGSTWLPAKTSLLLKIKSICADLGIVYYLPRQDILLTSEGKKEK